VGLEGSSETTSTLPRCIEQVDVEPPLTTEPQRFLCDRTQEDQEDQESRSDGLHMFMITSLDQKPETKNVTIQRSPPIQDPSILSPNSFVSANRPLGPALSYLHDVNHGTVRLSVEWSAGGKEGIFLRRPFNFPMNYDRRGDLDGPIKVPLSNCTELCKLPARRAPIPVQLSRRSRIRLSVMGPRCVLRIQAHLTK